MKKLILFLGLFLFSHCAWATISLVSSSGANNTSGSAISSLATASLSTTSGNFIVVTTDFFTSGTGIPTVFSVTDTAGDNFIQCTGCANNSSNQSSDIWFAYNITGNASNVVTLTFTPGDTAKYVYVDQIQWSGLPSTNPFQTGVNVVTASGTSLTTPSFNPTNSGLCIGAASIGSGQSYNVGSGYTSGQPTNGQKYEYNTTCASGSQTTNISWSSSAAATLGVASFSATTLPSYSVSINGATIHGATIN